ncbi:type II toxin-antitoxin system RnlA family toxin [Pseudanabaena sp. FACHB-1998]|uniref:type II toxin-antitoxin system RnlA family toxin n=1 Tax=Pseudanabaena sp. FACHB-1998 TaxID=2692858 RepID=UPI0016804C1F|nr:type II toxin-antitoxin system RnlA family toxin [Pseudanabaena sp. FACHB-1998]MBD2177980.1 type II toxin-antitoxin system RnlA family toxin [Pseudanabaena sp. FACHB-1998]
MSSDFKELNLDRTRLKESLEKFCQINNIPSHQYSEVSKSTHRIKYQHEGCPVTVDFIFITNGTTTIHTKLGKYPDKGELLAVYLKNNLVNDDRKSVVVTVKNIDKVTFDTMIEFFQELKNEDLEITPISISHIPEDAIKKAIRLTSQYNDSLTITYFKTTNTLVIQGKPLYGYDQATYFLSQYTDLDGFVDIVSKGEEDANIPEINKDNVEAELKSLLPNAYTQLADGILKMLRTSWTLKDISLPLPDYSCYVFPSLRALEGVMRKLLFDAGYSIEGENNNSFGGIFYIDNRQNSYLVKPDFRNEIGNDKVCDALEVCYTYFKEQRHELFHMNDFSDASRFIPTQNQASQIIEKVIRIIDRAYSQLI